MTKRSYDDHVRVTTAAALKAAAIAKQVALQRCCGHCGVQTQPECSRRRRSSSASAGTAIVLVRCKGGCQDAPWYCSDVCAMRDWPLHQPQCQHAINRFVPVKGDLEIAQESLVDELEVEFELTVLEGGFRSNGATSTVSCCDSDVATRQSGSRNEGNDLSSCSWVPCSSSASCTLEELQLDTVLAVLGASPEWTALTEAKEIVDTLVVQSTLTKKQRFLTNKRLLVALLQRLFADDRRLLKALCLQQENKHGAQRYIAVLSNNILRVLLWSDAELLSGKKHAVRHAYDKRLNPNAPLFLPSCEAIFQLLQAFPDEASFQMDANFGANSDLLEKLAGRPVISCQRSVLYFRFMWPIHVKFCASLLAHVYTTKDRTTPPHWMALAIKLWHHLVVCMSHAETAKAVLWAADQDHIYYSSSSSSGIKEYLRPLLRVFKTLSPVSSTAKDDAPADLTILTQSVYQVGVLLVAQSRRLEQRNSGMASFSTGEAFTLHTTKLENAMVSQFNKDQCRLWNEIYFPWAVSVVEQ